MNDEAALLAAIVADPREDTPRLVFADWLDENGQPERAEFIRGSIRAADIQLVRQLQEWDKVRDRMEALLRGHRLEWAGRIEGFRPVYDELVGGRLDVFWEHRSGEWLDSQYLRGFLEIFNCHGSTWARHGDRVRASQPVTCVWVVTLPAVEDYDDRYLFTHDPLGMEFDRQQIQDNMSEHGDSLMTVLCALRWPNIRFTFPEGEEE